MSFHSKYHQIIIDAFSGYFDKVEPWLGVDEIRVNVTKGNSEHQFVVKYGWIERLHEPGEVEKWNNRVQKLITIFEDLNGRDEMLDDCLAFISSNEATTISDIQRKFKLGYNRAARIIEALQEKNLIRNVNTHTWVAMFGD